MPGGYLLYAIVAAVLGVAVIFSPEIHVIAGLGLVVLAVVFWRLEGRADRAATEQFRRDVAARQQGAGNSTP